MSLNRTGIEWVRNSDGSPGFTWNPIVGCTHGCPYCWARKQAKRAKNRCEKCYRFVPHMHHERLDDLLKRKKPSTIAVGLMGDLFCKEIPDTEIHQVFSSIIWSKATHQPIFLTKNARRMSAFSEQYGHFLHWWFGVSIDSQTSEGQIKHLKVSQFYNKFISFEPLLSPIKTNLKDIKWIIIGGQTGEKFYPPKEWVMPIVEQAKRLDIPVFMKPNLGPEYAGQLIQEFPEELVSDTPRP